MAGLVGRGYRVVAISPEDGFETRLKAMGVEHIPIDINRKGISPIKDTITTYQYYTILKKLRPDFFLGYTAKPNIYGSLAAHRLGIAVVNNIAGLGEAFQNPGALRRIVTLLYRAALRRSATVFFQNPDDRALFLNAGIVNSVRTQVLPGSGIDLDKFRMNPRVADGKVIFLMVARLLGSKGVRQYADAARIVRREFPEAQFRLLGLPDAGRDAVSSSEVDAWQAEGVVEYLGAAQDVRPIIAGADCVVLPTYYPEGTPRALLEAAASGRALIATDVPGCREVVEDGVNGFLCEPRSVESLAAAMRRYLTLKRGDRDRLGAASRRRAAEKFDERFVVKAYLDALAGHANRSAAIETTRTTAGC
jgi:glycosyltransferase involved in cell wall biosynthesis